MIPTRAPLALAALLLLSACGGGGDAPKDAASEPSGSDAPAPPPPTAAAASGDTITIRMVTTQAGAAGQFEPAEVTAKPGDVLHFVSDGGAPHNLSFPPTENPGASGLPPAGTYLTSAGQAIDVPVTFAPGSYTFQCDPHMATGMKGKLTVAG